MSTHGTWSFYDPDTGLLSGQIFSGTQSMLGANTPEGLKSIKGHHDHRATRVDIASGEVIDNAYEPNEAEKRRATWQQLGALESSQHRAVREALLGDATAKDRLRKIDAQIASLRSQLT